VARTEQRASAGYSVTWRWPESVNFAEVGQRCFESPWTGMVELNRFSRAHLLIEHSIGRCSGRVSGSSSVQHPPVRLAELGHTTIRLPLGGRASTDRFRIRAPLVRPFWLLAAAAAGAITCFVIVRSSLW
jgi:hypothetical protein